MKKVVGKIIGYIALAAIVALIIMAIIRKQAG